MRRLLGIVLAIAVAAAALPAGMASAQTAYQTSFITSITYQNVGNAPATITFAFYPRSGQPINITRNLPANASDSLYIGAVNEISAGFSGSVVMSSAQPIVATAVQIPMNSPVKVRPLSNGFANGDQRVLVATVLKNTANQNTRFSVQNASNAPINWTVNFIPKGSSTPLHSIPASNIAAGASVSYDVGNIAQLGAAFDGSATIEASGQVVATALELSVNATGANSFEGVNAGGTTIYMPSAICNFSGQTSFYAITNTSATNSAQVTVTYRNKDGNAAGTQTGTIPANSKISLNTCAGTGVPQTRFTGSAVITSSGPALVAIGKIGGGGLSTAFVGANAGANKLALPYVRWANDAFYNTGNETQGQRTFITIQNAGSSALNTGTVTVRYVDPAGNTVGTHPLGALAPGQKLNSTPPDAGLTEFGYTQGRFGGGAIVEGPNGSQLVVVARVAQKLNTNTAVLVGEDYNGIPIQ